MRVDWLFYVTGGVVNSKEEAVHVLAREYEVVMAIVYSVKSA